MKIESQDFWISVHNLKSSDGGILDPDDKVVDVIDDKEQIKATFDVNFPLLHQNNGDGTSASSVGTSSPDLFRFGKDSNTDLHDWRDGVTGEKPGTGHSHPGRRDSDPLMEVIRVDASPKRHYGLDPGIVKSNNDQAFLHQVQSDKRHLQTVESTNSADADDVGSPSRSFDDSTFRAFMRTASRKSLNNGTAMMQWLEAQERVQNGYMRSAREEPIGSSDEAEIIDNRTDAENESSTGTLVEIKNCGSVLGIHVAPSVDVNGRNRGLEITFVEPGGYAEATQQLRLHDCVCEINGTSLDGVSFSRAQELLRDALKSETLRLRVRSSHRELESSSPADDEAPKDGAKSISSGTGGTEGRADDAENKVLEASCTQKSKVPPAPPVRNPATTLTTKSKFTPILNTRIIGHKIKISLKKGDQGLGFSVTTRDNPAGGYSPIYIKNILPQGAAILDGRLRSGDRLLEINGISMMGKTQSDVVAVLRDVKVGDAVDLVVSRHSDEQQQDGVDASSAENESQSASKTSNTHNSSTVLRLQIATSDQDLDLGISIKGRTEADGRDLGLFVNSISDDGAAKRDGRLSPNDQILEINGRSLVGVTNKEAVKIFLEALRNDIIPGSVSLTISRASSGTTQNRNSPALGTPPVGRTSLSGGANLKQNREKIKDHESTIHKAFRNTSYQLATDKTLEVTDDNDGSLASAGVTGRQSRFEKSTVGIGRPIKSSSGSESESMKRASVATGSSDFEGGTLQMPSAFDREGLGRRSMSEKRRAFVDPKSSAFFQKLKDGKNRSEKDATLKRSSSVESILSQAIGATGEPKNQPNDIVNARPKRTNSFKNVDDKTRDHPSYGVAAHALPFTVTKSRQWNESFRTAVDRSYVDQNIIAPPDGFRTDATRSHGHEPRLVAASRTVSKNPEINPFLEPSRNVSPVTVFERKSVSPTNVNHVYPPPASWQSQPGYRRYEQNHGNVPTDRNGYHGFREMMTAQQMSEFYSGPNSKSSAGEVIPDAILSNSRFASEHSSAFGQHYGPPISSQPCLNIHPKFAEHTGSLDSPKRNQINRPNRQTESSQQNPREFNDVRLKNYATSRDGTSGLSSSQTGRLHDLTNVTKSSRDLWSSSSGAARSGYPGYERLNNPRPVVQAGSRPQSNRKDEAQRQRGFVISSGAYV